MRVYWSLIGMLQWAVTLGRYDIQMAVSTMGRFRASPRKGHLERLARIFGYLRNFKDLAIKFKTEMPNYGEIKEVDYDWEYVYGKVKEELPEKMPEAKGRSVVVSAFADASLYSCQVTGRAMTGILMMLNKTLIEWYCKRQNTVETSTYGSEFVAAKIAVEKLIEIRYTLRMLGVPVEVKTYLFGDNKSVVDSSNILHST